FEFSAGGVVYREKANKLEILVAQHSYHHGWVFPKGLIDKDKKETKEDAALREVQEETGIIGEILKPIKPVTYWYNWEDDPSTHSTDSTSSLQAGSLQAGSGKAGSGRVKIKKTVYYFLMKFKIDTGIHDDEMERVVWIPQEEVMGRLTYKSDKEVWKEAKQEIENSA
ncbi:MAG: NUDIX domain-containing protein, partial [Patescibacteria group bacterium]